MDYHLYHRLNTFFEETAPYYEQRTTEKANDRNPSPPNLITKGKRQRNKTVKIEIGKFFWQLIKKHFSKEHKLYKIFNKNTLKLSYSCIPNNKIKINARNREILQNIPSKNAKHCNS